MSNQSQKEGRIKVNDLPRKEEELKDREAREIRGSGKLVEPPVYPSPTGGKGGDQGGNMRQ